MNRNRLASYILIGALAFVFAYFGIEKFTNPLLWSGWMPVWIDGFFGIDKGTWLKIIGAIELGLAILLLIPVRSIRQTAAVLIVLHLAGILTQTGWNDTAVRDIGLLLSGVALLFLL